MVLATLYAVGALLPFWYLASPEAGAAFFPPAGITLAALLLSRRTLWPLWLAIVFVTEVVVDLAHAQSVGMALGFGLANTLEPLVGALALTWLLRRPERRHPRQLLAAYLIAGVALAPAVGALVGATTSVLGGTASWPTVAGRWFLGDAIGVLVVATAILAWAWRPPFVVHGARPLELVAMVVVATAVTLVPAMLAQHPMLYTVLPVLMWAALRGGWRAVSLAGIGVAFATDWAAVTGRAADLFVGVGATQHLVFAQLFLMVTLVAALVLAVEVADRQRAEQAGREAEARRARAEHRALDAAEGERRRIARETHDIVGHALNVMLLHAGAARRTLPADAALTRECLEAIETAGRDAFGDLDVVLHLAEPSPESTFGRGLATVPALVDVMRQAGVDVGLVIEGDGDRQVTTLVDWSAYRIIQEALTNVAKHAPRSRPTVTVRYETGAVEVSVVNDAVRPSRWNGHTEGRGLIGMRERAAALGGTIDIGLTEAGFTVRARLPHRGRPDR